MANLAMSLIVSILHGKEFPYKRKEYMGISHCRICDIDNGSREYSVMFEGRKFIWPAGFRHYLEEHNRYT
jgi:hypothetical protein